MKGAARGRNPRPRATPPAETGRISYLYPEPADPDTVTGYLDTLLSLFDEAHAAGMDVVVVKLPLPEAFRDALPDEAAFDARLRAGLDPRGIRYLDLSAELSDTRYYFDTDHLNRSGVDALYTGYLRDLLAGESTP